jgi:hypothetical protein
MSYNSDEKTNPFLKIAKLETMAEVRDRQIDRIASKVDTLATTMSESLPRLTHEVSRLATSVDTLQTDLSEQTKSGINVSAKMSVVWGIIVALGTFALMMLGRIMSH